MENLFIRNAFTFVGSTPHVGDSSINMHLNSIIETYRPLQSSQSMSSQQIFSETFFRLLGNNEYIESTSPYDDDGC